MPRVRPGEGGSVLPEDGEAQSLPSATDRSHPEPQPAASPGDTTRPGYLPAGWYRDPGGVFQYRYWSGLAWTTGVCSGGWVGRDEEGHASPRADPGADPRTEPGHDDRAILGGRAIWLALGGLLAAVVLAAAGSAVASVVAPHSVLVLLLASQTGLWAGFLGAVIIASRRYGSGNAWRDFGVRMRGTDVARGFVISLIGRLAGIALVIPLVGISSKFAGSDVQPFVKALGNPGLVTALAVIALVGAPFVEELFFRGLLLRSLLPVAGTTGAIGIQAAVFALAHLRPSYGLGNVSVFAAIVVMGIVQGIVAERYRRLGPVMASHAFFNLAALVAIGVR